jgi:5-methyltetrahydropteroyltriglutamate--homocysteine methyltransferase
MAVLEQACGKAQGPPFRAEHVGSLLRPASLKSAFAAYSAGRLDRAPYEVALEEAVGHAVRLQEGMGLQGITDGEFGRSSWFGFFFERLRGFRTEPAAFRFRDESGASYEWPTCRACARIERHVSITGDEFRRLQRLTQKTPKVTIPSPSAFHFFRFHDPAERRVYPDLDAYWADLVAVYRAEIAELAALGCTYLQVDEVPLAMLCDAAIRAQVAASGQEPDMLVRRYVDVLRQVFLDQPAGITLAMHLCRGNFRGRWMAEGDYEAVAERLFNDVPVDAFFLEYDTPRAGDFTPLRLVPTDKRVVLGLISTKSAELERQDVLRRRIEEASRFVPLERLGLSPQCGFASVAGGNALTEADEIAKLGLVVEVASRVWG